MSYDYDNEGLWEERRRNEQADCDAEMEMERERLAAWPKVMAFELEESANGLVIWDQQHKTLAVLPANMPDRDVARFCDEQGWRLCDIVRRRREVQL